jgi:hypothetical protein
MFYHLRGEHLSPAPLQGMLLALPPSNRSYWRGLPGANTLAYLPSLSVMRILFSSWKEEKQLYFFFITDEEAK